MRTDLPAGHAHASTSPPAGGPDFRHEAVMYGSDDEFVEAVAGFAREGLSRDEPTLVMVVPEKIRWLQDELGAAAHQVRYADMSAVGQNPARIIPTWAAFVAEHPGRRLRGVGEPIWFGRGDDEIDEAQRHEALINLAFAGAADMRLVCPYDTSRLPDAVIDEAVRSHPIVGSGSHRAPSGGYCHDGSDALEGALPEPPDGHTELDFDSSLMGVRRLLADAALAAGIGRDRTGDLVLAVNELATNSVLHGGGRGRLRIWSDAQRLVCEVSDHGRIRDPLVGRVQASAAETNGRGMWLVHQLCDLAQVRSSGAGTVVRVSMWL